MDSTMYFFSGEATCLNVIPDCAVISVKAIFGGGTSHSIANKRYAFITSDDRITVTEKSISSLLPGLSLLDPSRPRAVSRLRLFGPRLCKHDQAGNAHGPDPVSIAPPSRDFQRCLL